MVVNYQSDKLSYLAEEVTFTLKHFIETDIDRIISLIYPTLKREYKKRKHIYQSEEELLSKEIIVPMLKDILFDELYQKHNTYCIFLEYCIEGSDWEELSTLFVRLLKEKIDREK